MRPAGMRALVLAVALWLVAMPFASPAHGATSPEELLVLQALAKGDLDGAEALLDELPPLAAAQYRGAIALERGDITAVRAAGKALQALEGGACPAAVLLGKGELVYGNPHFAVKHLTVAHACHPDDEDLTVALAAAHAKLADLGAVAAVMEPLAPETLTSPSSPGGSLGTTMGALALLQADDLDGASALAWAIGPPYGEVGAVLGDELTALKSYAPLLSVQVSSAMEYDTNAIFRAGDDGYPLLPDEVESSPRLALAGALRFVPLLGIHSLRLVASLYRSQHFADPADDLDVTGGKIEVTYLWATHLFGPGQGVGLSYAGSLTLLDGGRLLPEQDLYVHQERHEVGPLLRLYDGATLKLDLGYRFVLDGYAELARTGTGHAVSLGLELRPSLLPLLVQARLSYLDETAEVTAFSRNGVLATATVTAALRPWLLAYAGASGAWYDHDESDGFFFDGERIDGTVAATVGAQLETVRSLWVTAGYQLVWHPSTAPQYSYTKHVASVGVVWRYQ